MKKILFFALIVLVMSTFSSCEKRDAALDIVGTYEFTEDATLTILGATQTTTTNGIFYVTYVSAGEVALKGDINTKMYVYENGELYMQDETITDNSTEIDMRIDFTYHDERYTSTSISWTSIGDVTAVYNGNVFHGTAKSKVWAKKVN